MQKTILFVTGGVIILISLMAIIGLMLDANPDLLYSIDRNCYESCLWKTCIPEGGVMAEKAIECGNNQTIKDLCVVMCR